MAGQMSHREAEDAKECFSMFDKSGSGRVDMDQLGTVARALGYTPTEKQVRDARASLGNKRDFTSNDLMSVLHNFKNIAKCSEDDIREAFLVFDRDNSGFLNAAEFRHILTSMGEKLDETEMDELIREMVVGQQGQVKYDDLVHLMSGNM